MGVPGYLWPSTSIRHMNYRNVLLGILIVVPTLSAIGIFWWVSEQQYVAMTNLGLRLRVLHQSLADKGELGQRNWPSRKMAWKPMITAMQLEAKHTLVGRPGIHLSRPMHEQLSRFSGENFAGVADLKNVLSRLNFSDEVIEARWPIVFNQIENQSSLASVVQFHNEILAVLSSETAYSDWVSPILQQQQSVDKAIICKSLEEMKGFQAFSERVQHKCASKNPGKTAKWAVCAGRDEPINRQINELQKSLETNLVKFKSRWLVEDVNNLCSGT